ncbi:GrpB protein [Oceanobacillus limi]|uniref:GrpB protein n=1 Tax=Oceanobacillus limi TaxID=930131 RepID=A0A1H9ZB02_9BACI|nr:GrpB family protein [Oceanobacillus limi]SES78728.1 GrpB protein [Oceanobacillus limi]
MFFDLDPFFQQYFLIILPQKIVGLRANELCKLTVLQINFDHLVIDKAKNKKKINTVQITDSIQKKLTEYLKHKRVAHLHLMEEGEERWAKQLKFRDKLKTNAHLVEEYATIKRQLAKEFNNDREGYTEAKTEFINKVLFN